MAACVTGLCLTIYLFKSLVPVLSQLLKLGMGRATKGRSRHQCIGNHGMEEHLVTHKLPGCQTAFFLKFIYFALSVLKKDLKVQIRSLS